MSEDIIYNMKKLIDKLYENQNLNDDELTALISQKAEEEYLFSLARKRAKENYGNKIFIRGLIEISNICKNNCYYCGIRKDNDTVCRYRLTDEDILACCEKGYLLGFRTFVLQGGEDGFYTDEYLCKLISEIKARFFDCAVTLSLGERTKESYKALKKAGADRYLLRHETATPSHYEKLHPKDMSFDNRINSLYNLKETGFQTGCGFMVGSPFQTTEDIVRDLRFIKNFEPHMVGIGPFIPHKDTPFKNYESGSTELTVYLLSIIRLMLPKALLPATTALASLAGDGRKKGILAGANVIMPNLSPETERGKYSLYNNKAHTGLEDAKELEALKKSINEIGYEISLSRGDSLIKAKEVNENV